MRSLSASKLSTERRGSVAAPSITNQLHAKYKGLISTPGFCKFSAWRREVELPRQKFSSLLLTSIASHPQERLWLKDVTTGKNVTFGSVASQVSCLTGRLAELGISEGTVVCIWCSNYTEYFIICLAVWELAGTVLPVNCLISYDRLSSLLSETKACLLVCDQFNSDQALKLKKEVQEINNVIIVGQDSEAPEGSVPLGPLLVTPSPAAAVLPSVSPSSWEVAPLLLLPTKRQGRDRLVMHSHRSLMAMAWGPKGTSNHWFDQMVGETLFCGLWFFHFLGLQCLALSAIHGLSVCVLSEYSDQDLLQELQDQASSNAVLYPWQMRTLSQANLDIYDLTALKVLMTGGSILGPTLRLDLLDRLPNLRYIRESYGMKESGLVTYSYPKTDKGRLTNNNEVPDDHLMPVGLPNMWTSFKVVDRQSGLPVGGPDLHGELCVKSPQVMLGYLGEDEGPLDTEGYFHTGDLGYYDKDGVMHWVEQIHNLIQFWMYEVAPSVLETRLLSHSGIMDAAVISLPDKENGQVPRGFVVMKPGQEETEENLINFLESRLQDHERLRGGLHQVQCIPRDENWKVARDLLASFEPPASQGGGKEASPPRAARAAEAAAQLLRPGSTVTGPEETFGMKSRSRRGSQENLLEGGGGLCNQLNGDTVMRRESDTRLEVKEGPQLSYWLRVSISCGELEAAVKQHPGITEVMVRGVHMQGVGLVPRAYVVLGPGFRGPGCDAGEVLRWLDARLDYRHKLRGGLVLTDRLPRDQGGQLLLNLDKLDQSVVGVEEFKDEDKYTTISVTSI